MKNLAFYCLIITLAYSCASMRDPHYIKFKEATTNAASTPVKNITLIGMGKLPTRFFLDKIANRLSVDLGKKNIKISYYFLGNDLDIAKKQFDTLKLDKDCDAVMSMFQTDYAEVRQVIDDYSLFTPWYAPLYVIHTRFNQGFNISIFNPDDLNKSRWNAALNMDYDFKDEVLYKVISNKLITSFKKNNLCN